MAEQPFGSLGVSGSEDTAKYLHEIADSLVEIWESIEKTGQMGDQILSYMKEMPRIQQEMFVNFQQNLTINQQIVNVAIQHNTLMKEETEEGRKQVALAKEKKQTAEEIQLIESRKTAGQIMHPMAALEQKGLGMLSGPAQVAAILGMAALSTGAEEVSRMRQITRTGGEGMMGEGMGIGGAMGMETAMRVASSSIPFLKERYGSMQELTSGAATMYGQGGIRGENLTEVMEFLPKAAHEAGMSFQDASNIMAKANRVFHQSPKELEEGFKIVTDAAREAGYKVSDFAKFVYDSSFKLAQYGVTTEEMTAASKDLYETTLKGKISLEGLQKEFVEGKIKGMSLAETTARLTQINIDATAAQIGFTDVLQLRKTIEKALADKTIDFHDAMVKADKVTVGFAEALNKGRISSEAITSANDVLVEHFKKSPDAASRFAAALTESAHQVGYSGTELTKFGLDLSQTFLKITHHPEEAATQGAAVAMKFVGALQNLDVTTSDLNKIFSFTTEKLRMTAGESTVVTERFINLGRETDIQTASIIGWYEQLTSGMVRYFENPKEASKMAGMALDSTVSMLNSGKISVSEYTQIMKTQMDTFGYSGDQARLQFNTLANVVDKTKVRMEELAQQTSELAKINRQYGFDQQISNALLVTFSSGLQAGSISIGDLQAAMRGPGGAGEGVRAMIVSEMMSGGMFEGQNVSAAANISLPNLMRTAGKSPNQVFAEGGQRRQANDIFKNIVNKMVGAAGGDNEVNQLNALMQMSEELTGQKVTAYGDDLETLSKMIRTQDYSGAMAKLSEINEKGGNDPNDPQNKFKSAVTKLTGGTDKFTVGVADFNRAVHILLQGMGSETARDPNKGVMHKRRAARLTKEAERAAVIQQVSETPVGSAYSGAGQVQGINPNF